MNKSKFYKSAFNSESLDSFFEKHEDASSLLNYPLIYLLSSDKKIYIGETSNVKSRMRTHLSDKEKSMLEECYLIYHPKFNKSATYNIETNLIQYISADSTKIEVLNRTQNLIKQTHNYFEKRFFHQDLFSVVWERLINDGLAKDSLEEIKNKDIYKVSPFTLLNDEQMEVRERIVNFCIANKDNENGAVLLVSGEAGTGKSVLLSSTLKEILDEAHDRSSNLYGMTNNYLLVHHDEMIKTYQKIARKVTNFKVGSFMKPTSFINGVDRGSVKSNKEGKVDVVLIDEAHLLLTRPDSYNSFNYNNHLDEIIKRSKITIVIFDSKQVLKAKSYWDESSFSEITKNRVFEKYELKRQMRMAASEKSTQWINDFVEKKITKIPNDPNYEIRVFEEAKLMHDAIKIKEVQGKLSRVVATFDYLHKKDKKDYFVEEGDFKLPWNRSYKNTWAEERASINEVGSIYTIQGFDLNYVGVILGPSVGYDKVKDKIRIDSSKYQDKEAFRNIHNVYDSKGQNIDALIIKEEIILNSINVLMKRGIKGLYIYAANEDLRNRLIELQDESLQRK